MDQGNYQSANDSCRVEVYHCDDASDDVMDLVGLGRQLRRNGSRSVFLLVIVTHRQSQQLLKDLEAHVKDQPIPHHSETEVVEEGGRRCHHCD